MKKVIFLLFLLTACTTHRQVTERIVEIHDSVTVNRVDTLVEYTPPVEIVREVCPVLDTLYMSTSMAAAYAYVDTATSTLKGQISNTTAPIQIKTDKVVETRYKTILKTNNTTKTYTKKVVPKWCYDVLVLTFFLLLWTFRKPIMRLLQAVFWKVG